MADPYLGEIRAVGFNFAPQGWALCNGALLPINQNQALFALLGTTYGGNGTQNFALPNLQSRVIVGTGQAAGLPNYVQGQVGGNASLTLTTANLPAHAHTFAQNVSATNADLATPAGSIPAIAVVEGRGGSGVFAYVNSAPTGTFPAQNSGVVGGSQPISTEPPYLSLYFIIAMQGIFPSRQ